MNYKKYLFVGLLLIGLALAIAACSTPPTATAVIPTLQACPTCPTPEACPEAPACPTPVVADVPFEQAWVGSAHAECNCRSFPPLG